MAFRKKKLFFPTWGSQVPPKKLLAAQPAAQSNCKASQGQFEAEGRSHATDPAIIHDVVRSRRVPGHAGFLTASLSQNEAEVTEGERVARGHFINPQSSSVVGKGQTEKAFWGLRNGELHQRKDGPNQRNRLRKINLQPRFLSAWRWVHFVMLTPQTWENEGCWVLEVSEKKKGYGIDYFAAINRTKTCSSVTKYCHIYEIQLHLKISHVENTVLGSSQKPYALFLSDCQKVSLHLKHLQNSISWLVWLLDRNMARDEVW